MASMRVRSGIAALLIGLPALTPAAWAQLAPSPDEAPVSTAPPAPQEESVATFKLNVNLVDVFFTVKDKAGNLVPHLNKDDCTISEDNVPQKLKSFVAETQQPLTLGILLDTSGSQQRVLPLEQEVGSQFLGRVLAVGRYVAHRRVIEEPPHDGRLVWRDGAIHASIICATPQPQLALF